MLLEKCEKLLPKHKSIILTGLSDNTFSISRKISYRPLFTCCHFFSFFFFRFCYMCFLFCVAQMHFLLVPKQRHDSFRCCVIYFIFRVYAFAILCSFIFSFFASSYFKIYVLGFVAISFFLFVCSFLRFL